jgi:hypothetical protein
LRWLDSFEPRVIRQFAGELETVAGGTLGYALLDSEVVNFGICCRS